MPRSTALKGIRYQIEQLSYRTALTPVFDIHDVLDRNGVLPRAEGEHIPTSYLSTLYPEDAAYGPNYRQLLAFDAAFKRALHAKLDVGYVDAIAWLRDFIVAYELLPTSRQYTMESHEYRHLVDICQGVGKGKSKPKTTFYNDRHMALLNWADEYAQSLSWRERRQYLRLRWLPDYLEAQSDTAHTLMDVVCIVLWDVYQWLLQGDTYVDRKQRAPLRRRHAAFMAELAKTIEPELAVN